MGSVGTSAALVVDLILLVVYEVLKVWKVERFQPDFDVQTGNVKRVYKWFNRVLLKRKK